MPGPLRRALGLILVALVAVACSSPAATEPPTPSATPTALATTAPSPTEAPTPTPTPVAAVPLTIKWNAVDLTGIGVVDSILGVAKAGDTYVLLASLPYLDEDSPDAAVWWSGDGAKWQLGKELRPERDADSGEK